MNEIKLASIPEGGEDGQILKLRDGKLEWVSLEPMPDMVSAKEELINLLIAEANTLEHLALGLETGVSLKRIVRLLNQQADMHRMTATRLQWQVER